MSLCKGVIAFISEIIFPIPRITDPIRIVIKEVRMLVSKSVSSIESVHGYPGRPSRTNSTWEER